MESAVIPGSALARVGYADLHGYVASRVRGRVGRMEVRELLRLIEADGWYLVRTRGSDRQFKHPGKGGLVTVPGHPSDEVAPGTLNSIFKQAGLKP